MSLSHRSHAAERMDAADLDPATYAAVVGDLARVNRVTLAARPTLAFLTRAVRAGAGRTMPLRLLDVGFGDGDMLRRIRRWATRRGVAAELVGIDLNPRSLAAANARTDPALGIDYRIGDYAALGGERWDVIVSSLVAHHMTPGELTAFLRFIERHARVGWLVNDLHRHAVAHAAFPLLAAAMRAHPIVRHDGRVSIARSYRPGEWPALLAAAEVPAARVLRAFPFRLCVERLR